MLGQKALVLLIEDNADHAELVIRSLGTAPIEKIIHLTDGETALDYLLRRKQYADPKSSPLPHLILLDLRLPRIDGLEVLRTLKTSETLAHIPVVVLTTSQAEQDILRAYNLNANCYISKPVDLDQFMKVIKTIKEFWLTIVKLPSG